jgi:hypothetical protein
MLFTSYGYMASACLAVFALPNETNDPDSPGPKFDPITGDPLTATNNVEPSFDPITGHPLTATNVEPSFDPITGHPLNEAARRVLVDRISDEGTRNSSLYPTDSEEDDEEDGMATVPSSTKCRSGVTRVKAGRNAENVTSHHFTPSHSTPDSNLKPLNEAARRGIAEEPLFNCHTGAPLNKAAQNVRESTGSKRRQAPSDGGSSCGFGPCAIVTVAIVVVVGTVVGVLATSSGGHHANGAATGAPTPMPMPPQPQCQERMDGCCEQCGGCNFNSGCWTICCSNLYPGPGPAPGLAPH